MRQKAMKFIQFLKRGRKHQTAAPLLSPTKTPVPRIIHYKFAATENFKPWISIYAILLARFDLSCAIHLEEFKRCYERSVQCISDESAVIVVKALFQKH